MITEEPWKKTPWFLVRWFGKLPWRRRIIYAHIGGTFWEWEYAREPR